MGPPHRLLYIGFYETFFTIENIKNLCSYLGIPYVAPDLEFNPNPRKDRYELTEDERAEFAHAFKDVFEFAFDRFGREKIEQLWPSSRLI